MTPVDHVTQVRKLNERFYDAIVSVLKGDPAPMAEIWVHDDAATTSHPVGPWAVGWESVEATWWEWATTTPGNPQKRIDEINLWVHGEIACVTCVENWTLGIDGKDFSFSVDATNIYRNMNGEWKMIHHHADKAPKLSESL